MKILGTRLYVNNLVVKHRKHAILFENVHKEEGIKKNNHRFVFTFTYDEFQDFAEYIKEIANEAWKDIKPKVATSEGSDYYEYYDRRYDNNGYLSIRDKSGQDKNGQVELHIEAPYGSKDTLYQFNKPKIQSFIYDMDKLLQGVSP